ncbi:MAG: hypothetical protein IKH75_11535 [Ruminococcus sp.]|nr:hypothetical protein [Ruminococcus sp.]
MLSKEKFIAGMTAFKKCFVGWEFDLNDDMQIGIWYSALKNLTDEQFNKLIKEYYYHNKKPPMSVRDLTEILVEKFYATAKVKPEEALDIVREIISKNGGWDYGRSGIYKDLEKYPKSLTETVKEFERPLSTMSAKDTYTEDRFRRAYDKRLRESAEREVDKRLGLSIPQAKLPSPLGTSALPYEV